MSASKEKKIVEYLLGHHGRTYANEAGIRLERNSPAPLFQLLVASLLLSARIRAANAIEACRALIDAGLTTAQKMSDATWQERVDVLTANGYKRYDESTSRLLGDTAAMVLDEYQGDLRKLRDAAQSEDTHLRLLLQEFPGIGEVGADIFMREVQATWTEVYPFVDARAAEVARQLGLKGDPESLAKLTSRENFPRLVSALIRLDLEGDYEAAREAA